MDYEKIKLFLIDQNQALCIIKLKSATNDFSEEIS